MIDYLVVEWAKPVSRPPIPNLLDILGLDTPSGEHTGLLDQHTLLW
jgi:hypothetical protein